MNKACKRDRQTDCIVDSPKESTGRSLKCAHNYGGSRHQRTTTFNSYQMTANRHYQSHRKHR